MTPSPTLLCVDDEPIVLTSLREQFERALGGVEIEVAQDAIEALDILEGLRRDGVPVPVVISDHIMPGMKGDELLVRVHDLLPETRTILLTGQAGLDAVSRAVNEAGLYRYIAKPWKREDLVMTVREAFRSYHAEAQVRAQQARLAAAHKAATRFVPYEFLALLGRAGGRATGRLRRAAGVGLLLGHPLLHLARRGPHARREPRLDQRLPRPHGGTDPRERRLRRGDRGRRDRLRAAPGYLRRRGTPVHPSELRGHDLLGWRRPGQSVAEWPLLAGGSVEVSPWLTSADPQLLHTVASSGGGIMLAPDLPFIGEPEVEPLEALMTDEVGTEIVFRLSTPFATRADSRTRDTLAVILEQLALIPEDQ